MRAKGRYVAELDGLRGLAVAAVVAFHLADLGNGNRAGLLGGGWLGVDAFFTLSGYLITSLLLAELGRTRSLDLRAFWRRRVRRLQPGALIVIVFAVATAVWWAPAGTGGAVRGEALAALASVANWQALWAHHPYAAGISPSAFEHFWSLGVEEQFYVLWPLTVLGVAVVAARAGVRDLRRAVGGVAVAGVAASWVLLARFPLQRGYLGTDARMGSILVGAALAAVLPLDAAARPRWLAGPAGGLCLAGLAAMWVASGWPPSAPLIALLPLHSALTAGVIASVMLAPAAGFARVLRHRPLVGLGRVSYGVYLWHWPLFVLLTPERLHTGAVATDAVRLAAVAVSTGAMWVWVERPVRAVRIVRRTRVAFPMAATLAVAVVVVASAQVAPTPSWATARGQLIVSTAASGPAPRVLLVGDSIPTSLLAGGDATGQTLEIGEGRILAQFARAGLDAASMTITGCPVIDEAVIDQGRPSTWCEGYLRRLLPPAMESFRPDVVVWYSRADAYAVQLPGGGRSDPASSAAGAARLRARYEARIAWFAGLGARVILVSPGPNADGHDGADPRGSALRSMVFLDDQLRAVAAADPARVIGVVEMADLMCPAWRATHSCPDRMPGGGTYRGEDGLHFAGAGAVAAGDWLVGRVAGLVRAAAR